jgi:asparagine synthase (glutamine-hydrolysing)
MCGIAGLVNWGDRQHLVAMTKVQSHRGPDDSGVWDHRLPDGRYLGLGSRRLAIIDVSAAGHMPMSTPTGSLWITQNGEIYNYRELREELEGRGHVFHSQTDTEVILRLYDAEGPDCVRRLNGMFAFAIVDLRAGGRHGVRTPSVFLARDHFGIKPLYYAQRGARLAFASEVKALLQLPEVTASIDPLALHEYLTFLWVPGPRTMFDGIRQVPPGHHATFSDGELRIVPYWDLAFPAAAAAPAASEAELVEEVRSRFRAAVHRQMVSDVPVGAFLSAGLDSSGVVAMMSEVSTSPVRTYTIAFPQRHTAGESTLDDPAVAARTAARFGCDHHEIVVDPRVADLLPELVWHMDEPVADPAIITAYLVCREARATATVLLSGVGGDEVFGGYRKYSSYYWAQYYRRIPGVLRSRLLEPAVRSLPPFSGTRAHGVVRLAKKMARSASLAPADGFLMNSTYLDDAEKSALYTPALRERLAAHDAWAGHRGHFARVAHADFLHQMLYVDSKTFMTSLNLTYNDKMSMASSVEVRVPFLDRELVEFVAAHVPPQLKLNGRLRPTTKHIFRKAMQGVLPDEVLRQPKAGFGAPVAYWLNHHLRDMTQDLLSESIVRQRGLFEPRTVRRLVTEQHDGRRNWSLQVWQLLTLELWMRAFTDGAATGSAAVEVVAGGGSR